MYWRSEFHCGPQAHSFRFPPFCKCDLTQRHDLAVRFAEAWRAGANHIGDERRRKMAIEVFDHSRILVPEILSDHEQWYAVHYRMRCPCVPQTMERDTRLDLRPFHRLRHRAV